MKEARIIIVEDEVLIAEFLKDVLEDQGFKTIDLAHDYDTALSMLKQHSYELAFLDIQLNSELKGIELGSEISKTTKIPFIYLTAHSANGIMEKALATKPNAFLTKPFKKSRYSGGYYPGFKFF